MLFTIVGGSGERPGHRQKPAARSIRQFVNEGLEIAPAGFVRQPSHLGNASCARAASDEERLGAVTGGLEGDRFERLNITQAMCRRIDTRDTIFGISR
jgi:hypothetical protein